MADDGVGQTVTAKSGVTRTTKVDVKNPWMLAPFRTFPEVAQPESPFILRMDKDSQCALFEGDELDLRLTVNDSPGLADGASADMATVLS